MGTRYTVLYVDRLWSNMRMETNSRRDVDGPEVVVSGLTAAKERDGRMGRIERE